MMISVSAQFRSSDVTDPAGLAKHIVRVWTNDLAPLLKDGHTAAVGVDVVTNDDVEIVGLAYDVGVNDEHHAHEASVLQARAAKALTRWDALLKSFVPVAA